jgi:hypothetical protein
MSAPTFNEKHFTVAELAEMWSLSDDAIRRFFMDEPGVVKMHSPPKRYKRVYTTLRIPQSVAERVHRRMQVP